MAQTRLVVNPDEGPIENEIPDPPPEENTLLRTEGSVRLAMKVLPDLDAQQNEIPDPPPEENT
jgi:hypothetical protein